MTAGEGTDGATDAEVAAALGVGQEADEQEQGEADPESEEDEASAEIEELKREVARLRREAAARRVRDKAAKAKVPPDVPSEIEAARVAGREEARAEHGLELATERIRAALTGIVPDDEMDDYLDDLNITRYVTDEHKPDTDAISALKDRHLKLTGGTRKIPRVNHGRQGDRSTQKSTADQFADTFTKLLS